MLAKIVGALVGRALDRRDGDSGVKGAVIGAIAAGALRRAGPIGLTIAGGVAAARLLSRSRKRKA